MTPEQQQLLTIGIYLLGWAVSVAWPFLVVRVQTGATFDWRKVGGRIAGGVIGLVLMLVGSGEIATIGSMSYLAAFVAGLGFSSLGNNGRRTYNARKNGG